VKVPFADQLSSLKSVEENRLLLYTSAEFTSRFSKLPGVHLTEMVHNKRIRHGGTKPCSRTHNATGINSAGGTLGKTCQLSLVT
jgi:hypothetical protein